MKLRMLERQERNRSRGSKKSVLPETEERNQLKKNKKNESGRGRGVGGANNQLTAKEKEKEIRHEKSLTERRKFISERKGRHSKVLGLGKKNKKKPGSSKEASGQGVSVRGRLLKKAQKKKKSCERGLHKGTNFQRSREKANVSVT